jgi:tRNA-uridine 2-sulfurtransferase
MKIAVAMSGGVDSSTVAALLCEQGHEVMGLAMKTHSGAPKANRACCTPDDMRDARLVADKLGIPFYVLNYEDLFKTLVVEPFAKEYQRGYTPNPCVVCNDKVKFEPLQRYAELLGAEKLATGHYARIENQDGHLKLLRGVDTYKDQSYFLYRLREEQLERLMFPLGEMNKDQVRAHAERLGLSARIAQKQESQEICFVGEEGYAAVVDKILGLGAQSGKIIDSEGNVLGEHQGVHYFTIGQRRGLKICGDRPLYVTGIDAATQTVTVGDQEELLAESITLENTVWVGELPREDEILWIQQRHRGKPVEGKVKVHEEGCTIIFSSPSSRGAPGQAAVIYRGDAVVGGGRIAQEFVKLRSPLLTKVSELSHAARGVA